MPKLMELINNDENGSIMVIALVMLVLLTLIGITASTTSEIEIQIARNEKEYINEFIVADSAWREGVEWLNTLAAPPDLVNIAIFNSGVTNPGALNVKNFGDLGAGLWQLNTTTTPPNGTLNTAPFDVDYWYQMEYSDAQDSMSGVTVPGSGPGYRRFYFTTRSVGGAGTQRTVEVNAGKIYQVGY